MAGANPKTPDRRSERTLLHIAAEWGTPLDETEFGIYGDLHVDYGPQKKLTGEFLRQHGAKRGSKVK